MQRTGYSPSSPVLSPSPDGPVGSAEISCAGLRDPAKALARQQAGTDLVGHADGEMEREISDDQGSRPSDRLGRLAPGLGSNFPGGEHGRTVVSAGTDQTHQLSGAVGSYASLEDVRVERDRFVGVVKNRQHDGSSIHKQSGGNSIPRAGTPDPRPVDVVPREEHPHTGKTPPRRLDLNTVADRESRCMRDRSDWKLDTNIFDRINQMFGPLEVVLFASRLTHQCRRYFSWRPDPFAEATDAFLQDWSSVRGFANPPWNLVPDVLAKTQSQGAKVILVAPVWKAQPWYPRLLEMLTECPRLLPRQVGVVAHLEPQLAVWSISGKSSETSAFQSRLLNSSSSHGGPKQASLTTHSLGDGIAGVVNGAQIPFQDL